MTTSYVPRVTVYGDFSARTLTISEALAFTETHDVTLILGAMREDGTGRELVTTDDLRRWDHEGEVAAQWADITGGEAFAHQMGIMR